MRTILRYVLVAATLLATLALAGVIYVTYVKGPTLHLSRNGPSIHIEALFLEYALGLTRLVIVDVGTSTIVLEATAENQLPFHSIFDLAPGYNDARTLLGPNAHVITPPSGTFLMRQGHTYAVTVWGNNGSARIRSTAFTITM